MVVVFDGMFVFAVAFVVASVVTFDVLGVLAMLTVSEDKVSRGKDGGKGKETGRGNSPLPDIPRLVTTERGSTLGGRARSRGAPPFFFSFSGRGNSPGGGKSPFIKSPFVDFEVRVLLLSLLSLSLLSSLLMCMLLMLFVLFVVVVVEGSTVIGVMSLAISSFLFSIIFSVAFSCFISSLLLLISIFSFLFSVIKELFSFTISLLLVLLLLSLISA